MAHRSRVGVVLIDVPEPDHAAAVAFWSGVTGMPPAEREGDEPYVGLGLVGPAMFEVQRTGAGTPARIHLDVETDDVPAECARLLALGAELVEQREDEGYSVLRDPGGLLFCVVPVQTGEHFADAATWPDADD